MLASICKSILACLGAVALVIANPSVVRAQDVPTSDDERADGSIFDAQPDEEGEGFYIGGGSMADGHLPAPDSPEDAGPDWSFAPTGFLRVMFTHVERDENYEFIGRNNGFQLNNWRVGFDAAHAPSNISIRMSADGAVDVNRRANQVENQFDVRVRDGYVRWDPNAFVGFQAGQFRAPFTGEEQRSTADLLFMERAVGEDGVLVTRGFEQIGLDANRQLGIMIQPADAIAFGPVRLRYHGMIANGNGQNQLLNDNDRYAVYGRIELGYEDIVRVGAAGYSNVRTEGVLPNLFNERDEGVAYDALFTYMGAEVYGQWMQVTTEFRTDGSPDREQVAYHVQAGYTYDVGPFYITPAYRYAYFQPWNGANDGEIGTDLESFEVTHHSMGLRFSRAIGEHMAAAFFEYTIAQETEVRRLNNDQIKVLLQVVF